MRQLIKTIPVMPVLLFFFYSCSEQSDGLAPYAGSSGFSKITIQDSTFRPEITWIGGYVSVLGINLGSKAALDSTLVYLVYKAGNDLHYPISFGVVPSGAQDLTSKYGGNRVDSLTEDGTYTFWILKENEWNQISSMHNEILIFDPDLSESIKIEADTVRLSDGVHDQVVKPINVYINITINTKKGEKLGKLTVEQTNTSNNPIIKFTVTQVEDQLISAIGITEGGQFNQDAEIWNVLSVSDSAGETQYAKANVIGSPLIAGAPLPGTQVFTEYPAGGLKHNTTYYLWIANKLWDGEGRLAPTDGYAYISFDTK